MAVNLFNEKQRIPAECKVTVDGDEVPEYYPFLREINVSTSRTEAWTASLHFATVRDELGSWEVLDDGRLVRLAEIELIVVFGSDEETLFKGYIREINSSFPENAGEAEVTVECQDQSLRLDRDGERDSWGTEENPTDDKTIIKTILQSYGLTLTPDSKEGQGGLIELPQEKSDISFLYKRARENNYELIFYPDVVYFGPYRIDGSPQPIIQVYAGQATNCLSMDVTTDGHLPDIVKIEVPADGDRDESESISAQSDLAPMGPEPAGSLNTSLEPAVETLNGESGASEAKLRARAQATINDIDLHRVQAEGELDGSLYGNLLHPGGPVPVDGLGERLSGLYYVDRVEHHFDNNGYRQRFSLLRNAFGDNVEQSTPVSSRLMGVF